MKTVIVVFGNAGHGKDTLADIIADLRPDSERYAFATPVKMAAKYLIGIPEHISFGSQEDKASFRAYGKTARQWLQWVGTEAGREAVHTDVWVHRAADAIREADSRFVIISDGRFENERTALKETLGEDARVLNVLVVRPGVVDRLTHPSETVVHEMRQRHFSGEKLFDAVVHNDGTIDDLRSVAKSVLSDLMC